MSAALDDAILQQLRNGPKSGLAIARATGASQSSISRSLVALVRAQQVVGFGNSRRHLYGRTRAVRGMNSPVTVARISQQGRAAVAGQLWPIYPRQIVFIAADGVDSTFEGLPWFMLDMRPNGFLGRQFPMQHPDLMLGNQINIWSDDEVLMALSRRGEDAVGDLIIGDESFERYFRMQVAAIPQSERAHRYTELAEQSLKGQAAGSSAGGEQPKFGTSINCDGAIRSVLVKFSANDESAASERMRDLLVSEHLALECLRTNGVEAPQSAVLHEGGRIFLEVVRFDRPGQGRRAVVSLTAVDAEFIGEPTNWVYAAERLVSLGMLTLADARTVALLDAFGRLIANTDMHYGNLSFFHDGQPTAPQLQLAPAYDMLPMRYAPVSGELVAREFSITELGPRARWFEVWPSAVAMASAFWESVAAHCRISAGFKAIAAENALLVRNLAIGSPPR